MRSTRFLANTYNTGKSVKGTGSGKSSARASSSRESAKSASSKDPAKSSNVMTARSASEKSVTARAAPGPKDIVAKDVTTKKKIPVAEVSPLSEDGRDMFEDSIDNDEMILDEL